MTFGILCKAPEDWAGGWKGDQPEVLNGWHWWGALSDRRMSRALAQRYIDGYTRADRGWRYQMVRTG